MTKSIRKVIAGSVAAIALTLSAFSHANPVERVVSLDVSNSVAQIAAMDQFFSSVVMNNQKVTLWAPMFPGAGNASHTLVIGFDSFEDLVARDQRVFQSPEWATFQQAAEGSAEVVSNSMAQQLLVAGSGWSNHGALLFVSMSVKDPVTYAAAFAEMIKGVKNPGSIRLMQMRYGGGATTHVALFSAPDAVAANQYVDYLQGNKAFQDFAARVVDNRKVNNISMMRRVKTWGM
jgi:hypothetical protein